VTSISFCKFFLIFSDAYERQDDNNIQRTENKQTRGSDDVVFSITAHLYTVPREGIKPSDVSLTVRYIEPLWHPRLLECYLIASVTGIWRKKNVHTKIVRNITIRFFINSWINETIYIRSAPIKSMFNNQ
jgi:hypothetical protein